MQPTPGRVHLVSGKRISRHAPLGNDHPVKFLDCNSVRREHGALIGRPVGGRLTTARHATEQSCGADSGPAKCPSGETSRPANDRGLNPVVVLPTFQAAMRFKNFREQLVHRFLSNSLQVHRRRRWVGRQPLKDRDVLAPATVLRRQASAAEGEV